MFTTAVRSRQYVAVYMFTVPKTPFRRISPHILIVSNGMLRLATLRGTNRSASQTKSVTFAHVVSRIRCQTVCITSRPTQPRSSLITVIAMPPCRPTTDHATMDPAFVSVHSPLIPSPSVRARRHRYISSPVAMRSVPPTHTPSPRPAAVITKISALNKRVQTIRCPFWRRRFTDSLETALQVMLWVTTTRHKSLPLPVSLPHLKENNARNKPKLTDLDLSTRLAIIRDDLVVRQYYVTGRLSMPLYADDCLFNSPDPDGRVRGTRKFCDATAGLFDAKLSRIDLIDIYATPDERVVAEWRLQGALMLPWRPCIKPFVGRTTYQFNEQGLVCSHVETWDISVVDAFVSVVVKGFGKDPAPSIDEIIEHRRSLVVGPMIHGHSLPPR